MARKKNMVRRNEILSSSFALIKENGLDKVSLQMIADKAEISKSLLQSYYPHKVELINDILSKTMSTILVKLEDFGMSSTNAFAGMMVYINTILELGVVDHGLYNVLDSIFGNPHSLDRWVDLIIEWMKNEDLQDAFGDEYEIRIGLTYVLAGGTSLYLKRDEFRLTAHEISTDIVTSFLSTFMRLSKKQIDITMRSANELIKKTDINEVHKAIDEMFVVAAQ